MKIRVTDQIIRTTTAAVWVLREGKYLRMPKSKITNTEVLNLPIMTGVAV